MINSIEYYNKDSQSMPEVHDNSVSLVLTDPPYGRNYVSKHRLKANTIALPMENDAVFPTEVLNNVLAECYRVMKENSAIYMFTDWQVHSQAINILQHYFVVKNTIVWVKNNWTAGDLECSYAHQYEIVLYAVKGKPILNCGRPTDVIYCTKVSNSALLHPTQKPVSLLAQLIRNSSMEGDIVLDPFAGVASTLQAAQLLMRKGVGYEIDKVWYDKGLSRLQQQTLQF